MNLILRRLNGMHTVPRVLSDDGRCKVIRLRMKDVSGVVLHESLSDAVVPSDGYFLDTGTRHFVRFVMMPRNMTWWARDVS